MSGRSKQTRADQQRPDTTAEAGDKRSVYEKGTELDQDIMEYLDYTLEEQSLI